MASMLEPPVLTRQKQNVRRDTSLMRNYYRHLKQQGDYGGAMKVAQAGDSMGIPIGRTPNDAELDRTAGNRVNRNAYVSGKMPASGGLDGFDFRHSNQGGAGVGGYDFRQRASLRDTYGPPDGGARRPSPGGGALTPEQNAAITGAISGRPDTREPGVNGAPPLGPGEEWDSVHGRRPASNIDPGFVQQQRGDIDPGFTRPSSGPPPVEMPQMTPAQVAEFDRTARTTRSGPAATPTALPRGLDGVDRFVSGPGSAAQPTPAAPAPAAPQNREMFRQRWHGAKTQDEKDRIIEEAQAEGIPMNRNAIPSLFRRGIIGRGGPTWSGLEEQRKWQNENGPTPNGGMFTMAPDDPNRHPNAPARMYRNPDGSPRRSVVNEGPVDIPAGLAPTQQEQDAFQAERRAIANGQPAPSAPAAQTSAATPAAPPRTYETAAAMRARLQREMAPARQASTEAIARRDAATADTEAYAQQTYGMSNEEALDPARVQQYHDARVNDLRSSMRNERQKNQVSLMAQKLVGMPLGEAERYIVEHPEYGTSTVQKEYDRIRKLLPEDEKKSTWELTGMTERLKRRAESMGVPHQFLR